MIPPTVAEVRRLIRAMMGPEEHKEFRLGCHSFGEPTKLWPNAATKLPIGKSTMPPTIASLSKMLVEEVAPTRLIPAKAPRQRYLLMPKKLVF